MALEWRLRKVMAEKGIWSGAELGRLMESKAGYKLTPPSISALLTAAPKQVKSQTMDALCTALDCSPSDLWKHTSTYTQALKPTKQQTEKIAVNGTDNKKLPPI